MCTVSMIGDHYMDKWKFPSPGRPWDGSTSMPSEVSRMEFEELKKEVLEMKEILKRAKKYDEDNNEPDCEIDEKMAVLRKVAELVGISLDDVLGKPVEGRQS